MIFNDQWRRQKYRAFDLQANSTARATHQFDLWGRPVTIYANANFSIYSAQRCNAACRFCVEELRPASRGTQLNLQKSLEPDDSLYFEALEQSLDALRPLAPTLSITGGEASKDRRLPRILQLISRYPAPRKTLTTNGSGLFDNHLLDHPAAECLTNLNISVAHPDRAENVRLMRLPSALQPHQLAQATTLAKAAGIRVRLSCVLLREGIGTLEQIRQYLAFAQSLGVDNVIFRQLMRSDPATHLENSVVTYSDHQRVAVEPLLDQISADPHFTFTRQILGYYYYVEVWRYQNLDVVFEEADLSQIELAKRRVPGVIHELIFHPNARLASTWQPWDGILGPPPRQASETQQHMPDIKVSQPLPVIPNAL